MNLGRNDGQVALVHGEWSRGDKGVPVPPQLRDRGKSGTPVTNLYPPHFDGRLQVGERLVSGFVARVSFELEEFGVIRFGSHRIGKVVERDPSFGGGRFVFGG